MRVAHILYPVLALALSISSVVAVPSGNSMAEFAKRDPKPEAAPSPSEPYMSNARRLAEGLPLNPPSKRASGQLARRSGIATYVSCSPRDAPE